MSLENPELYQLTAVEALGRFRRRDLSVVDYLQALLARIDAVDSVVDAWVTLDREGALRQARELDQDAERRLGLPLFGIPVGLKDIYATRDLPTTAGFPPWRERIVGHDAATVERLRANGAIVLGKTVTTQFAYADPPPTHNPWDLSRTPGGSSSGSAAAVSAGMVPLALGTQTAGSILRPAAYCGIVGLKPTYGLISRFGIHPLADSMDHPGPLARSVDDLALALQILAGADVRDPSTRGAHVADYRASSNASTVAPSLTLLEDFFDLAEPAVAATVREAVGRLEAAGATIRAGRLETPIAVIATAQQTLMELEAAEGHRELFNQFSDDYGPFAARLVRRGRELSLAEQAGAHAIRESFRAEIDRRFTTDEILLLPTVSNVAPLPETTGDRTFQAPWSLIGVPAVTIPAGLAHGLPVGLQLVANRWQDARLLAVARWVEASLPRLVAPL